MLLGSYDKRTKFILNGIKQEIAKFSSGKIFVGVLSNLNILDTDKFQVLTETEEGKQVSLFIIKDGYFEEAYDLPLVAGQNEDEVVREFLVKKYGVSGVTKQPPAVKLDTLMRAAEKIFLIREKTETRGGEYVELMYVLEKGFATKVWFFKREAVKISTMLMEFMDMFEVLMRPYFSLSDLNLSIVRILEYCLAEFD
ncbi:MAG: hypothetical protein ACE14S_08805 [Candidatus Bathyarchaeia archaeon]